jgi:Spy/CpxP family protein refolding chaperone
MRKFSMALVMAGALALLCSAVTAQEQEKKKRQGPPGGGFGFGGPGFLLRNDSVQKELKVSDDQKTKLKEAVEKVREDHKGDFAKLQDVPEDQRMEKAGEIMRAQAKDYYKAAAGVLDDKQIKRLKQIDIQQQGTRALSDPDIQKGLKITDEQKKKILAISEEQGKKMRELFGGGFNEETRKKMADLRKETEDKVNAVLTDDQKKTLKEMKGEPFEIKFERRPGGGAGGDRRTGGRGFGRRGAPAKKTETKPADKTDK